MYKNSCFTKAIQIAAIMFFIVLFPPSALSQPPAPNFLPGFPMLAGKQIMVMWVPVPGAVKYNVYMNDKKMGEAVAPPFQFDAPTAGGSYNITMSAVDGAGKEGVKSPPGVISIIVLEPPTNVSSNLIAGMPAVRWNEVPGVAFYNVYRRVKGEGEFVLKGSVQTNNYRDSDAKKGTIYEYAVTAKNVAGVETDKNAATVVFRWPEEKAAASAATVNEFVPRKLRLLDTLELVGADGKKFIRGIREMLTIDGQIYVIDNVSSRVVVADESGQVQRFIAEAGFLKGQLSPGAAYAAGLTKDGDIAIVDGVESKVVIYSPGGDFIWEFGVTSPNPPDELSRGKTRPYDVAQDSKGNFFVTDNGGNRVLVFDEGGNYLREFGGTASQKNPGGGYFSGPVSIVTDKKDNVYVTDYLNGRVQKLDNDGKFIRFFGVEQGAGKLLRPNGIYFGDDGTLYVIDGSYNMVHGFDPESGKYLFTFTNEKGEHDDTIATWPVDYPNSISIDGDRMYLVQQKKNNIMVFGIIE